MANKVKDIKKKGRRLRRSIRKTLGTLFLVSALVVAAIPVDNLQASGVGGGIESREEVARTAKSITPSSDIPQIDENDKIYTSEDKLYRFAYIQDAGNYVAVLLGYDKAYVEDESLTIPNTVAAYAQYTINLGTDEGYVAVGRNGNFLFYRPIHEQTYAPDNVPAYNMEPNYPEFVRNVYDEDGELVGVVVREEYGTTLLPCYLDSKSEWENIDRSRLYYDTTKDTGEGPSTDLNTEKGVFARTTDQKYQRITNAVVAYIGNQYLEKDETTGIWKLGKEFDGKVTANNPQNGVFAGASNVVTLHMGEQFRGIGDYAFYGSGVTSIQLENGLNTIGQGAFQECIKLQSISLSNNCPLQAIGAYAFKDCNELISFALPWSVRQIGDSAFEGCKKIQQIDLCSEGTLEDGTSSNLLSELGRDVFKNCEVLQSLTFPDGCSEPVYISAFEGCNSLRYICARNTNQNFPEEDGIYSYEQFKTMLGEGTRVNGEFYFEGFENSKLHEMTQDNCFAFSYLTKDEQGNFIKQDRYEITMNDEMGGNGRNIFIVTSANNLCSYAFKGSVSTIEIPKKIGPYDIITLDSDVIANYCNLETVIIPNTVKEIGDRAFQGCHNLTNVIFSYNINSGENVLIGADAFRTQKFTGDSHKCNGNVETNPDYSPVRKLAFTGPISSEFGPYQYAMSDVGTYNAGGQSDSYITYYSGWPQNLEVEYNANTKMSELVNFPKLSELDSYDSQKYKYLALPGAEKANSDKTVYEDAMQTAYAQYQTNASAMTPNQRSVIDAALNLVIPEGVESVRDGLFKEKEETDEKKTVTAYSIRTIKSGSYDEDGNLRVGTGTFAGCENLTGVSLLTDADGSGVTVIEDHAFEGCKSLTDVSIAPSLTYLGICPFYGCEKLSFVNFQGTAFVCDDKSIIYGLDSDGNKVKIIECLEGRTDKYVEKDQVSQTITELAEEAFRGSNVSSVDLTGTSITTVPVRAFAETTNLDRVYLPATLRANAFQDYAFDGSTVDYFVIESAEANMLYSPTAFTGLMKEDGVSRPESEYGDVQWYSPEGSGAQRVGEDWKFNTKVYEGVTYYYITFTYWDDEAQDFVDVDADEQVPSNQLSAVEDYYPVEMGSVVEMWGDKYRLTDWKENTKAQTTDHLYFEAVYSPLRWVVTFQNYNGDPITTIEVPDGGGISESRQPVAGVDFEVPEGRTFQGWEVSGAGDLSNITSDLIAVARYTTEGEYLVEYMVRRGTISSAWEVFFSYTMKEGETAPNLTPSAEYDVEGYRFTGWDKPLDNISESTKLYAQYEPTSSTPTNSPNPGVPTTPPGTNPGNPTASPGPNPGNPTASPGPNPGGPTTSSNPSEVTYKLTVRDGEGSGDYKPGEQIIITANEAPEGMHFAGWDVSPENTVVTDKTRSVTIITMPANDVAAIAKFEDGSNSDGTDPSKLYTLQVMHGSGAGSFAAGAQVIISADAAPDGQEFSGWDVSPATAVITDKARPSTILTMPASDVAVIAQYKDKEVESTPEPQKLYNLVVQNGNGSGSYAAGSQVVISAHEPAAGQQFSSWTISPDSTVVTDKTLSAVVITMPESDVAAIANYRARATGSSNTAGNITGSGNAANTNTNRPTGTTSSVTPTNRPSSGSGTSSNGGTTVVIDKNGLSNTGVVSATVNGSSDNFVLKITESTSATEAVLKALLAEYGNVDNIKYFPMDISLYDSTGNTKITDTTGLSVNITLPLPDSLIQYAGNNKAAGVVNDKLDKLNPRFSTINGVSCITFTAEHFSPYVIYVDLTNLSDGTISDNTPTTGDGIHPKWFLSIGLACLSFVMFMMKDNARAPRKKQKVVAR